MGAAVKRKYEELFKVMKRREAQGRRMRWVIAPLGGLLSLFLAGQVLPSKSLLPHLIVGILAFLVVYAFGMRTTLEAQRTLILVDTENNTAEIVELLKRKKEPETKTPEPEAQTKPEPRAHW